MDDLSWHATRSTELRREADVSRMLAAQRDTRRAARLTSRATALFERAAALAERAERRAVQVRPEVAPAVTI